MKTGTVHFSPENERYLLYDLNHKQSDNREARQRMKLFLLHVMDADLTPMQKYCFTEHVMNGRPQKEIAEQLGLNCSTVCRHIAAGRNKLKKAAGLFEIGKHRLSL